MRVTIIPSDQTVIVDGVARVFAFEMEDEKIHAVQWHGENGTIEYKSAKERKYIENFDDFADIVTAWEAAEPAPAPEPLEE